MSAYIFVRAYDRNVSYERVRWVGGREVETAHRMHIADLQTWADVQMAGAFGRLFFTSTSTTAQLQRPTKNPQLPPSVIHPGSLLHREPPVVRNEPAVSFLYEPKIASPTTREKRTTATSRRGEMTQSHHLL